MKRIELGKYKHFKGNEYEVIGVAKDSETLDEFVVYKALYGDRDLWIRPLKIFLGKVTLNSKKINRFQKIK